MVKIIVKPLFPDHPMFSEPATAFSPRLVRASTQSKSASPGNTDGPPTAKSEAGGPPSNTREEDPEWDSESQPPSSHG